MTSRSILAATLVALTACVSEAEQQPPPQPPPQPPMAAMPPPPAAAPAPAPAPAPREISITSRSPEAVEAFRKGRDFSENFRPAEAADALKKAIQIDPQFALAQAYLGSVTPEADGIKLVDQAVLLSKALPEAERLVIEGIAASKHGDMTKSLELSQKIVTLVPGDWRAHFYLGADFWGQRRQAEASASLKKAIELNAKAGPAYNLVGYIASDLGKHDEAIAAFKKYTEVSPTEPNAHDSLADAYLGANKLEDAEGSYRKAIGLNPAFFFSWQGVAQTKFLRRDWTAGREALAKSKEAAPRATDKSEIDEYIGWSLVGEGKYPEGLKAFNALEKSAGDQKLGVHQCLSALNHAFASVEIGKGADAIKEIDGALDRAEKGGVPGEELNFLKRWGYQTKLLANLRASKGADAQKTLAQLDELAKKNPGNAHMQSALHYGRGMAAWAGGDAKAAVAELTQCQADDTLCRWQLAAAQEKAGDKAGADATKAKILEIPRRDSLYLYVHVKLAPKAGAKAKAAPADKPAPASPTTDKKPAADAKPAEKKPTADPKPAEKKPTEAKPAGDKAAPKK